MELDRRSFLRTSSVSLSSIALSQLLSQESRADGPLAAKRPHFGASATSVIYLHMIGAPSQLDLFEHKPELSRHDGEPCPPEVTKDRDFAFIGKTSTLAGSPFRFRRAGQCGHTFSELLPNLATVADDLAFVRTVRTEEINHAPAQMFLHSGFGRGGRPSFGSWVTFGLGSPNENLPAYVVLLSGPAGGAGSSLWSPGFLPSIYQGVQFRSEGDPVLFLSSPAGHSRHDRRRVLDALGRLNRRRYEVTQDPEIETRVRQYEMAFRMQASVPDLMSIDHETPETRKLYGAEPGKASFANNCLLARRLVERGVRLVELYDADWDHHGNLPNRLRGKCGNVDQAMAGLIVDLKRRGLLDQTLIVWGSEFGRTPLQQGKRSKKTELGRDHHKDAFTMWFAGGGVRGGVSHGRTDPLGMDAIEDASHVHDINATILHTLGLDHEQLTYRKQGREFRLTDVHGEVLRSLL